MFGTVIVGLIIFTAAMFADSARFEPKVDESIEQLGQKYKDIEMMLERAKREARDVQRRAKRESDTIASKITRRVSRSEHRAEQRRRREEQHQKEVEELAQKKIKQAEQEAEQKAHSIIADAEKKALELRKKLEAQELVDAENSKAPITREWREEMKRVFKADSDFIKQIVIDGEASTNERKQFVSLFDDNQRWFVKVANKAKHYFDQMYASLIAKKNALAVLVDAQKQADDMIAQVVDENMLPEKVSQQLRLMALYEINTYLRKRDQEQFVDTPTIAAIVTNIAQTVSAEAAHKFTIKTKEQTLKDLEKKVAELEVQLQQTRDTLRKKDDATQLLEMEKEELLEQLEAREKQLIEKQKEVVQRIRESREAIIAKEAAFIRSKEIREESREELQLYRAQLEEEKEEYLAQLEEERVALVEDAETQHAMKTKGLRKKYAASQTEVSILQDTVENLVQNQQEVQKDRIKLLRRLAIVLKEKETEHAKLRTSLKQVSDDLVQLHINSAKRKATTDTTRLADENKELSRRLQSKSLQQTNIELELARTSSQLNHITAMARRAADAYRLQQRDLFAQEAENDSLKSKLLIKDEALAEAEKRIQHLSQTTRRFFDRFKELAATSSTISGRKDMVDSIINSTLSELHSLRKNYQKLSLKHEHAEKALMQKDAILQYVYHVLDVAQGELSRMELLAQEYRNQLSHVQTYDRGMELVPRDLGQVIHQLNPQVPLKEGEAHVIATDVTDRQLQDISQEIKGVQASVVGLQEQLNTHEQRFDTQDQEIEQVSTQLEGILESVGSLSDRMTHTTGEQEERMGALLTDVAKLFEYVGTLSAQSEEFAALFGDVNNLQNMIRTVRDQAIDETNDQLDALILGDTDDEVVPEDLEDLPENFSIDPVIYTPEPEVVSGYDPELDFDGYDDIEVDPELANLKGEQLQQALDRMTTQVDIESEEALLGRIFVVSEEE